MQRIHIITDEQDADRFLRDLVEQAQWHEVHKPAPAPQKAEVLERLITQQEEK